jgi:hypothetical protein
MNYNIYITKTSDISEHYYIDFEHYLKIWTSYSLQINSLKFYKALPSYLVCKQFKKRKLYYEV